MIVESEKTEDIQMEMVFDPCDLQTIKTDMYGDTLCVYKASGKTLLEADPHKPGKTVQLKDQKGDIVFEHPLETTVQLPPLCRSEKYTAIVK